jgi:NMD protein affecting ribosome stability and mRNA decay
MKCIYCGQETENEDSICDDCKEEEVAAWILTGLWEPMG